MIGPPDQDVITYRGWELLVNTKPIELEDGGEMYLAVLGAHGLPMNVVVPTSGTGDTLDEAMDNCVDRLMEMIWQRCVEP